MPDNDSSTCGGMIKRCVHPSAAAVAEALAADILRTFAADRHGTTPTAIMLAGGRTPKAAYQILVESGHRMPSSWSIMISDERWVPADHPDSNYRMLRPFLNAMACPPERQIMVNTALPREESAADFGRRLDAFFQAGGMLTTSYLGLGADGHTASLFSHDDLQASAGKSAIDVDRPDGNVGISATPRIIQRAARIVFVVTGADKNEIVDILLRRPMETIAGHVVFPNAGVCPQPGDWSPRRKPAPGGPRRGKAAGRGRPASNMHTFLSQLPSEDPTVELWVDQDAVGSHQ